MWWQVAIQPLLSAQSLKMCTRMILWFLIVRSRSQAVIVKLTKSGRHRPVRHLSLHPQATKKAFKQLYCAHFPDRLSASGAVCCPNSGRSDYWLIFFYILFVQMTWLLPSGEYVVVLDFIIPNSLQRVDLDLNATEEAHPTRSPIFQDDVTNRDCVHFHKGHGFIHLVRRLTRTLK